jgi:hypothetical protein
MITKERSVNLGLSEKQIRLGLGAMKRVASANGVFEEPEKYLLEAAAHALGQELAADDVPEASAREVAAAVTEPIWRQRIVQSLVVTAMIDGQVSADEVAVIDEFARELEVSEPRVASLHHIVDGHMGRMRFDFVRRAVLPKKMLRQTYERDGFWGAARLIRDMARGGSDYDAARVWRWRRLGLLPEGTLGREFWRHMTERQFALPGELGGLPEVAVHHDLTHVLTGYDTDPSGETQIAAFYSGYFKEDPFAFLFMGLLMFQLGIKLAPVATPAKFEWDPVKIGAAIERGSRINIDPTENWDYWAVMDVPLVELRRRYGID